ncbi:MAG TPA: RNA-binding cell elongation regulator Jag/EloR [Anaerolineales bacterium]|nr:RNA-binding cell elongation regulator Jag/EloR [Anaerolineales bacterium]
MNQRTTLEIIAPTVEEAIAQGLAQLGLTADAVSVEVLDAGTKGFFGLGKTQVRVRLTVNPPGGMIDVQTETAPVSQPEAETVQKRAEPAPMRAPAPERSPRHQEKPSPVTPPPVAKQAEEEQPEHDALLDHAESVISKMLHLLKLEAQVSAHYGPTERDGRRNIHVDIRGNDLSVLIGRRSETLAAFQYIASLIVGKEEQQFVQLTVDVEGYRDRREKQLIQMAKRMADQVAKSGRRQTLEPMPSGERRIIHIALRDHPDVKTESTGEEPYRKVMILPKKD